MKKAVIVIVGPTSSGKSKLAVKLAVKTLKRQAEIISVDSRQIYKDLDIGSGKISSKEMKNIPHHLLSIISPKRKFTAGQYKKYALEAIKKVFQKGKIPILVGGTIFYLKTIIDNLNIPPVKPNWKLRKELEKKSLEELTETLKKLDPQRAKNIDLKNPRRIVRALEIILTTKKPVPLLSKGKPEFDFLIIGIKKPFEEIKSLIKKRLQRGLKQGMITEVKKLKERGLSWKRLEELGLEYRYIAQYLQNKITFQEMKEKIQKGDERLAKSQLKQLKKDKRIHWVSSFEEADSLVKNFLKEHSVKN